MEQKTNENKNKYNINIMLYKGVADRKFIFLNTWSIW